MTDLTTLEPAVQKTLTDALVGLTSAEVTSLFHKLFFYCHERTWRNTRWMGTSVFKCPFDLWVYQEIIYELRPDLIIESGTAAGGSAHYMAQLCELIGNGSVITIDIAADASALSSSGSVETYAQPRPRHPRIEYILGSSTDDEVVRQVRAAAAGRQRVLVILDSCHDFAHVLQEMRIYSELVTPGSYLIIEDSNQNGHPVNPTRAPGPMQAIEAFLAEDKRFASDHEREKYFVTFNPKGYLRRID